ncbi:MAG: [LysW]-aminoadipate kinase [Acidobacteriota bacterium]
MWVIKIGGGEGNALEPLLDELARDYSDQPWVLVHGGSKRLDEVSTALGHPPRRLVSPSGFTSRRTDRRTALTMAMVCGGEINKRIVEHLQSRGVDAFGLTGVDGALVRARRKHAVRAVEGGRIRVVRDDYTGTITGVRSDILERLLDAGLRPVVSPPALSEDGEMLNVDGDRLAAAVAAALGAERLLLLTGAPGLLRRVDDPLSRIERLGRAELDGARRDWAEGRMRLKLKAAGDALDAGISEVLIGASHADRPIRAALAGGGTVIR